MKHAFKLCPNQVQCSKISATQNVSVALKAKTGHDVTFNSKIQPIKTVSLCLPAFSTKNVFMVFQEELL